MTERTRALKAFDDEFDVPPGVSLVAVEIPFWNLVNLVFKVYFAIVVASAMVGAIVGALFLVYALLTK